MELSVIIPCLNEEETLGICLEKATKTLNENNVEYEIIVADNGSDDDSIKIATKFSNVKVINVKKRGYGIALRTGISSANGKYILMADADDSYDFNDIMKFLNKTRSGYQLVQGCRFPSGGGKIEKGAMPLSHRIFGNPLLSKIAKTIYGIPFNDIYCGMRCFEKEIYFKKNYFSKGMTFAVENLIKLFSSGAKSTEVPITLYKDGRIKNQSHLKTISDGLQTLKLLLICSPKWLYFYPSLLIFIYGLSESLSFFHNFGKLLDLGALEYTQILKINFIFMISMQIFSIGIFTNLIAYQTGLQKKDFIIKSMKYFNLNKFLLFIVFILAIIFCSLFFVFHDLEKSAKLLITYCSLFFGIIIFFNALFISLLELTKIENE